MHYIIFQFTDERGAFCKASLLCCGSAFAEIGSAFGAA